MRVREVTCKSILTKSGIGDYSLNPYFGCQHSCVYCYARYLLKYRPHEEEWGEFVDVKINAPRLLQREVLKRRPGVVFISSACDAYQPLEGEIGLTRRLIRILSETDFQIRILTKSALVRRDFDLLLDARRRAAVGVTVTTMSERLRRLIEPNASPSKLRIEAIEEAKSLGMTVWAMVGPLMPFLTDTAENIQEVFEELRRAGVDYVYVDRLNKRSGVWESILSFLSCHRPALIPAYKLYFFDSTFQAEYLEGLRERVETASRRAGLQKLIRPAF